MGILKDFIRKSAFALFLVLAFFILDVLGLNLIPENSYSVLGFLLLVAFMYLDKLSL